MPRSYAGRRSFDLTTNRDAPENYELIQVPNAVTINVENSDSEAFLHFGRKENPGFSTLKYQRFKARSAFQQIYLENGTGATGTLELTFGVDMEAEPDLKIDSIETIENTVTTDMTDDDTRILGDVDVVNTVDASAATVPVEQQTPAQLEDSTGTNINPREQENYATTYTSVDLNTAATTTIYSPTNDAHVTGVHIANGGGTAELRLEVTDGTNTAVLDDPGAGSPIHFTDETRLAGGTDSLQIVVETAEGSALSETAAVSRGEL